LLFLAVVPSLPGHSGGAHPSSPIVGAASPTASADAAASTAVTAASPLSALSLFSTASPAPSAALQQTAALQQMAATVVATVQAALACSTEVSRGVARAAVSFLQGWMPVLLAGTLTPGTGTGGASASGGCGGCSGGVGSGSESDVGSGAVGFISRPDNARGIGNARDPSVTSMLEAAGVLRTSLAALSREDTASVEAALPLASAFVAWAQRSAAPDVSLSTAKTEPPSLALLMLLPGAHERCSKACVFALSEHRTRCLHCVLPECLPSTAYTRCERSISFLPPPPPQLRTPWPCRCADCHRGPRALTDGV
jgi:hypothetical protein